MTHFPPLAWDVTYGTPPAPNQSCKPDGQTRWATRTFDDGTYAFTTYNGWLIESETRTTDLGLADIISRAMVARYGPMTFHP